MKMTDLLCLLTIYHLDLMADTVKDATLLRGDATQIRLMVMSALRRKIAGTVHMCVLFCTFRLVDLTYSKY